MRNPIPFLKHSSSLRAQRSNPADCYFSGLLRCARNDATTYHSLTVLRSYALTVFFLLLLSQTAIAQKYAIHFKDKEGTPYQLDAPSQFLSEGALERRYKFDISFSDDDLPVNPAYIQQVADKGATILFPSKWLNCVLVQCDDAAAIDEIKTLECVERAVLVAPPYQQYENPCESVSSVSSAFQFYGNASDQIEQLNGIALHNKGYDGEGVLIAVLDGGFCNVNTISALDHL